MTEHYLDLLARTISENWDQPALTDFYLTADGTAQDTTRGNHYTYGEMYLEMLRVGKMLRALGIRHGDHIAICGGNSSNWAVAYLAIAAYQGVTVTVLHTQATEDIARQIDFSDAVALFTDSSLWSQLKQQNMPQVKHVIFLDDLKPLETMADIEPADEKPALPITIPHGSMDDLDLICFTSGSTGTAKGIMLSYRNLSASAKGVADVCVMHENRKTVSFLPLSHAYVLGGQLVTPLTYGNHVYSLCEVKSPSDMFRSFVIIQPFLLFVVPLLVSKLGEPSLKPLLPLITKNLEYLVIGGAKFPIEVENGLVQAGVPIAPGYGVTETAALISLSNISHHRLGASGKVTSTLTARIAPNGEILVKGENVMLGYYKDPEATARKIDKDGWLHTGDRGRLDEDNYLYVEGRLEQDIIVLPNGENIHPEDIESKINALPEVAESIVLARDGKLVALVHIESKDCRDFYPSPLRGTPLSMGSSAEDQETRQHGCEAETLERSDKELRLHILRTVNPQLPLYSQLYDVEFLDAPLQRTEKQTIKRYLYK